MSFARYLLPLNVVAVAIVAVACSGADSVVSTSTGTASSSSGDNTSSSGRSSTSSGFPEPFFDAGPSASSSSSSGGGAIDPEGVVSFTMRQDECAKPSGKCLDAQGFTVDFVNAQLTSTTCVELAGANDAGVGHTEEARTTKKLSPGSLATIRKSLRNVVVSQEPAPAVADGHSWLLNVSSKTQSNQSYSGWPGCDAVGRIQIESGWEQLWDTIRAQ